MQKKSKEFFNLFMNEGTKIEQEYTADQITNKILREQGVTMAGFQEVSDKKSDQASAISHNYLVNQFNQARKKSIRMNRHNIKEKLMQDKEAHGGNDDKYVKHTIN